MSAPPRRFRSAIDIWFVLVLIAPTLHLLWYHWRAFSGGRWPPIGLIVASTAFAGVWLMVATTRYDIDDRHLRVRCGPFRTAVPLQSIHTLRATNSMLSAPALSLRRIEVLANGGPCVVISPRDRAGFVAAIRQHVPDLRVDGVS
jgi:hypothetical protein